MQPGADRGMGAAAPPGPRRRRLLLLTVLLAGLLVLVTLVGACSGAPTGGAATTASPTDPAGSSTTSAPDSTTAPSPSAPATTAPPTTAAPSTTAPPTTTPPPPRPVTEGTEYALLPGSARRIALTFDAAYDPEPLADILRALSDAGVHSTFFLTGEFVEDFPAAVRQIRSAGHEIGNHSYSHPDFTELGAAEIRSQLRRTADALEALGVPDPRPLFRPPFGARDERVLDELAGEGYVSVYWTIDTLDWKPERTPEEIRATVREKARPGAIVLMHIGSRQTAAILPTILQDLEREGYELVTVGQAIR